MAGEGRGARNGGGKLSQTGLELSEAQQLFGAESRRIHTHRSWSDSPRVPRESLRAPEKRELLARGQREREREAEGRRKGTRREGERKSPVAEFRAVGLHQTGITHIRLA